MEVGVAVEAGVSTTELGASFVGVAHATSTRVIARTSVIRMRTWTLRREWAQLCCDS
jgi:hypothetical protein